LRLERRRPETGGKYAGHATFFSRITAALLLLIAVPFAGS
jgi:hypothetical protein